MTIMLGIKLDDDLGQRFADFARSQGRGKSEIGRRALIEYLERHSVSDEFRRQLLAAADEAVASGDPSDAAFDDPDWGW
jgi:predicted transcriptional regulator